jgi:hypothetical protein
MALIDKLTGTKFLFNKELISYPDLVKLLQDTGFTTKFIQKPITDNLEVHSLYIKPELEIAYLAQSANADKYYETAGYSCVAFEEFELQDVLDILGYKQPVKEVKTEDLCIKGSSEMSKFFHFNTSVGIYSFRKNEILRFLYSEFKFTIYLKNNDQFSFELAEGEYLTFRNAMDLS